MGLFLFMEETMLDEKNEQYELFDLSVEDQTLVTSFKKALQDDVSHWNAAPFNLDDTDRININYWLGEQLEEAKMQGYHIPYVDNRLTPAVRAVLAYVNNRIAQPDITPSSNSIVAKNFAKDIGSIMFQHGLDNKLKQVVKKATFNLVVRKRGFIKLRFDPNIGEFGEIIPENIDPSDIIVEKNARYGDTPRRILHKQSCTIEELIVKFPDKEEDIKSALRVGDNSDQSKTITYWEGWVTHYEKGKPKEGVAWYLPKGSLILGKMSNPNFVETGDDKKNRKINFFSTPIKPFIVFNYMNTGKSYIDETCLFSQAIVQQDILNRRGRQIMENADYANGRVIADADAMNEDDASTFLNKNPKTIMLMKTSDGKSIGDSVMVVPQTQLPTYVIQDKEDARNEIDQIMGSPKVFQGQESNNNTLGQDTQNIQQAGALQDDLASAVDEAMEDYYRKLFHMMKVYYTEDRLIQVRGTDGKFDFVTLTSDSIDTMIKVSVEASSTTPANKKQITDAVVALAKLGQDRIDNLTLYEALNLPEPEKIAERVAKSMTDPASYLSDIDREMFNREADSDIRVIISGKEPDERDEYAQTYLEYFNNYIMSNKFTRLDVKVQEAIKMFLAKTGMKVARTANLGATQTGVAPTDPNVAPVDPNAQGIPQAPVSPDQSVVQ